MGGLVNEVCQTKGPVHQSLLFSLIVGLLALFANSVEIWYLRKMEVDVNDSYKPFIYNMAIADLASGIGFILTYVASILGRYAVSTSRCEILVSLTDLFLARACMMASGFTLSAFTIVKTLGISLNKHYKKSTLKKVCVFIWIFSLGFFVALGMLIKKVPEIKKHMKLSGAILAYPGFMIMIVCYINIFLALHRSEESVNDSRFTGPPGAENHQNSSLEKKFKRVATLHLLSLVVTFLPYITFNFVLYLKNLSEEESRTLFIIDTVFWFVADCNSVADPIMFFLVFCPKHQCRVLP